MGDEKILENEELNKSIDALTSELFKGYTAGRKHPENIDIYKDAEKTADEAVNKVKKSPNDDSRGAGRPKQISDVPDTDEDGKRDGKYDKDIASNENKEDEPDEVKKQIKSMDQTIEKYRHKNNPKAPEMRPFMKSEDLGDVENLIKSIVSEAMKNAEVKSQIEGGVEISKDDYAEYQVLKKAKSDVIVEKSEKLEILQKSELQVQNDLLKKSLSDLTQKADEQNILLQKIARRPITSKSITNINALEKSVLVEGKGKIESFSKAEIGDAVVELVKSNKLPDVAAIEFDFNNTIFNPEHRAIVDNYLNSK